VIVDALLDNTNLRCLDLSDNRSLLRRNRNGAEDLGYLLERGTVVSLKVNNTGLDDYGLMKLLRGAMAPTCNARHLGLSGNAIGPTGANWVATAGRKFYVDELCLETGTFKKKAPFAKISQDVRFERDSSYAGSTQYGDDGDDYDGDGDGDYDYDDDGDGSNNNGGGYFDDDRDESDEDDDGGIDDATYYSQSQAGGSERGDAYANDDASTLVTAAGDDRRERGGGAGGVGESRSFFDAMFRKKQAKRSSVGSNDERSQGSYSYGITEDGNGNANSDGGEEDDVDDEMYDAL
jgi:hypothetical protein